MTGAESLLCSLLECGYLDLSILDDVGYDLGEIVENLRKEGYMPTLNDIITEIFCKGRDELTEKLKEKINDLIIERDETDDESYEYEELQGQIDELRCCDTERDIEWYCNSSTSLIWFSRNGEIYRNYLKDEISEIEYNMGFEF